MKSQILGVGAAFAVLSLTMPAASVLAQDVEGPATVGQAAVDTTAAVGGDHGNFTLKEREDWLKDRLHRARDDHAIDGHEFDRVNHEIGLIQDDENHMRSHHDDHQLTDNETASLEVRLDGVASQIHWLHEEAFQRPW